jgi:hypothetical protein
LVAVIDEADWKIVSQHKWHPHKNRNTFYARANIYKEGRRTGIYMHTLLTGWSLTDHEDHNGLNNQRSNLRSLTNSENVGHNLCENVYKRTDCDRWHAEKQVNGIRHYLGLFKTKQEALDAVESL